MGSSEFFHELQAGNGGCDIFGIGIDIDIGIHLWPLATGYWLP